MKQIFSLIVLIPALLSAQCPQTTEEEFAKMQEALEMECKTISKAVPCEIGIGKTTDESESKSQARRDAIYKLAQSVEMFISYIAKDSVYNKDGDVQKLSTSTGKINIETKISGIQHVSSKCGTMTDEFSPSGKPIKKVLTLMSIDPQLYEAAKKELLLDAPENMSSSNAESSSSKTEPSFSKTAIPEVSKTKATDTVWSYIKKSVKVLLGIIL